MVAVQNNAPAVLDLPGVRAGQPAARPGPRRRRRFDLEVTVAEVAGAQGGPGGLAGQLTVAADVFDAGTARLLAERLVRVLAAVAADPGARLHAVAVLDEAERAQLVTGWNDTGGPVPAGTLPELVGAQAAAAPGCGGGGVRGCVRQLRASWMGGRGGWRGVLAGRGAGPESVVAVVLGPVGGAGGGAAGGAEGGGGVPAGGPGVSGGADRVHARRRAPGAGGHWPGRGRAAGLAVPVLAVGRAGAAAVAAGGGAAAVRGGGRRAGAAGHPAYVIYTSGSTGVPKGVVVPHARAWSTPGGRGGRRWGAAPVRAGCRSRRPVLTSSVLELLVPLVAAGGWCVAVLGRADPAWLLAQLARRAVTLASVVPSVLRGDGGGCRPAVMGRAGGMAGAGGEALQARAVRAVVLAAWPGCRC